MTTELMQKLKDAGFPLHPLMANSPILTDMYAEPTLSEMIMACGKQFGILNFLNSNDIDYSDMEEKIGWHTCSEDANIHIFGKENPEEAVAELWLMLKK